MEFIGPENAGNSPSWYPLLGRGLARSILKIKGKWVPRIEVRRAKGYAISPFLLCKALSGSGDLRSKRIVGSLWNLVNYNIGYVWRTLRAQVPNYWSFRYSKASFLGM